MLRIQIPRTSNQDAPPRAEEVDDLLKPALQSGQRTLLQQENAKFRLNTDDAQLKYPTHVKLPVPAPTYSPPVLAISPGADLPVAPGSWSPRTASLSPLSPLSPVTSPVSPTAKQLYPAATDLAELYRYSISVPGSRQGKQIYPFAPVRSVEWAEDEYGDRFAFVAGELKKAVDSHPALHRRARYVCYDLRMVGPAPEKAYPSIVVKCTKADVKPLRALFAERATDKLYCRRGSSFFRLFKEQTPSGPPFRLVYYQTDALPLIQRSATGLVQATTPNPETFCGASLQCQDRIATAAFTLRVNHEYRVLTVDHLFGPSFDAVDSHQGLHHVLESNFSVAGETLNDDDMVTIDQLWIDDEDVEGDLESSIDGDDELPEPGHTSSRTSLDNRDTRDVRLAQGTSPRGGRRIEPIVKAHSSKPDLDWALVDMERKDPWENARNFFYPDKFSSEPVYLLKVGGYPRGHGVPVYVVSGASGVRTGKLLRIYTYVGSRAGQELSRTWTLILDDPEGIRDGDCGSAVVDKGTHEVYGHVIGADPTNHGYVAPLSDTIIQIQSAFNSVDVKLPRPLTATKSLARKQAEAAEIPGMKAGTDAVTRDETAPAHRRFQQWLLDSRVRADTDGLRNLKNDPDRRQYLSLDSACDMQPADDQPRNYMPDDKTTSRYFIPLPALQQYLDPGRVQSLLLEATTDKQNTSSVECYGPNSLVEKIRSRLIRVFAILVSTRNTSCIHRFVNNGLDDQHLPLRHCAVDFLGGEDGRRVYESFEKAQWMFWSPTLRQGEYLHSLSGAAVLPIVNRRVVSATTTDGKPNQPVFTLSKVQVHPDMISDADSPRAFILKTYRTIDQDLYRAEMNTFRRLKSVIPLDIAVVVAFSSFEWNGTFNVLFPCHDATLSDFFRHAPRPTTVREGMRYWAGVLKLPEALRMLHSKGALRSFNRGYLSPENIVWYARDSVFKIDLSRLLREDNSEQGVSFSPPESGTSAPITPCHDVWSLGCLLLEFLIWHFFRSSGLVDLRLVKRAELQRLGAGGLIYHDGTDSGALPPAVTQVFEMLRTAGKAALNSGNSSGEQDAVTTGARQMARKMLVPEAKRPGLSEVQAWAAKMLGGLRDAETQKSGKGALGLKRLSLIKGLWMGLGHFRKGSEETGCCGDDEFLRRYLRTNDATICGGKLVFPSHRPL